MSRKITFKLRKLERKILFYFKFSKELFPISTICCAKQHLARLREVKRTRNSSQVLGDLRDLKKAAADEVNLMPFILRCVKSYATLGEIIETMKEVFGEYEEPVDF